jgi:hypothetical protein
MFSTIALQIPTDTMHELLSYLRSSGSDPECLLQG